ncbi:wax ester/triacylglycerol synthase family O-acyltransferase [Intrasporangium sp.]|uniref:wax ester/triacylglycerol synthase family O-acyltransferase n=1 Tax=Intrasporangium sp. TaxID=1925024 RepID=UPI003222018F
MSSTESIFLRLERDGYPMDVAGIYLLEPGPEGPLPLDDVRALFGQRLSGSPVVNRMVAHAPLGIGEDRWTQTDYVDLEAHVRHRHVPAPGELSDLLASILEISGEPLDRGRPLWQAWYLTGLADGRTALVLRLHHAVIDGMGMIALQQLLFDAAPTPVARDREPAPLTGRAHPSVVRRALVEIPSRVVASTAATQRLLGRLVPIVPQVVEGSTRLLADAAGQVGALARVPFRIRLPGYVPSPTDAPPVTLFNQHVSDPLKSMAVVTLPFEQVQSVRPLVAGATVNDVLLALVTGAMRDYLAARDDLPARSIRTTCPVNVRTSGEQGTQGNHITTMWVDLPVHLAEPVERLAAVRASSAAAKAALPQSQADWDALADVGDLLLPGIVTAAMAFAGTKAFTLFPPTQNLTVSSLAGPREPTYLATSRVANIFLRGIVCPPIHLFVAAITNGQHVDVSVTTVRQLCPDPQALVDGMRVELDRLLAAGS